MNNELRKYLLCADFNGQMFNEQKQINEIKEYTEHLFYKSPRTQNDEKGRLFEKLNVEWIDNIMKELQQEYPMLTYEISHNPLTPKKYKRNSKNYKVDVILTIKIGSLKPFKIAIENKLQFKPTWVSKAWINKHILNRFTLTPEPDYYRLCTTHGIQQTPTLKTMLKTNNITHITDNYVNTLKSIIKHTIIYLMNRINNTQLGYRRYTYSLMNLILSIENSLIGSVILVNKDSFEGVKYG